MGLGWSSLRKEIYRRDRGICQACLMRVGRLWDLGHLVDRCIGGCDAPENLVLMCVRCNRSIKPVHRTLEEAWAWLEARREAARTGREIHVDWRPFYAAMYGRGAV
ncbi:MAG TPA: HNH endonuclease [Methylomirabilota bacterium]|nr:HNH endonuclease [Methylomirabilota bacterium]